MATKPGRQASKSDKSENVHQAEVTCQPIKHVEEMPRLQDCKVGACQAQARSASRETRRTGPSPARADTGSRNSHGEMWRRHPNMAPSGRTTCLITRATHMRTSSLLACCLRCLFSDAVNWRFTCMSTSRLLAMPSKAEIHTRNRPKH
jgi:hypothetical protein